MAMFDNDPDVASVYERADQLMYGNKDFLKSRKSKEADSDREQE